ncbi:hypothetical protein L0V05_15775 [Tabrizicola sp. J26]|uniref:hypothetical protein n=1 Tax=Alitabrizicola rongguiensis TaxID=2909234 RepID=UPI001F2126EC|nr:hypothetical protein [Tabrizicola rongguiensis]MCF1710272.1 hypothetical protein [Tabrizicola rongguiensis]
MRILAMAAAAILAAWATFGEASAATTGSGVYLFRSYPSYSGPIVGSFSFTPGAIEAAKKAGKSTATITYDDLVSFDLSDTKAKLNFTLSDVLPTFAMTFLLPKRGTLITPIGDTDIVAVAGYYSMSFVGGLGVRITGPRGSEIKYGYWGEKSAYVPLPASLPLLAGALGLGLALRRRRPS